MPAFLQGELKEIKQLLIERERERERGAGNGLVKDLPLIQPTGCPKDNGTTHNNDHNNIVTFKVVLSH